MKKKDLVDHIENLKGKLVVGNDIQGLFNQISKLSENVEGHINQVFCLGALATVRITKNSPAIEILHEKDLLVCQECFP